MPEFTGLCEKPFQPDWQGLVDNIRRQGTPQRVFNIELFHDAEVIDAVVERFDQMAGQDRNSPDYDRHKLIAFQGSAATTTSACSWT